MNLSNYEYLSSESIPISSESRFIYEELLKGSVLNKARITKTLFKLKNFDLPKNLKNTGSNFIFIESTYPEIYCAIVGKFWKKNPGFKRDIEKFHSPKDESNIVIWKFSVIEKSNISLLRISVYVKHNSDKSKRLFTKYWKKVKLLSRMFRYLLLFELKIHFTLKY